MYVNSKAANNPIRNNIDAALGSSTAQHHNDNGINADNNFKIGSFILLKCLYYK